MDSKTKSFVLKVVFVISVVVALSSLYQLNQLNSIVSNFGGRFMYSDQIDQATYMAVVSALVAAGCLYFLKKNKNPEAVSSSTHIKCPDCAELVRAEARKCKHCGATLDAEKNMQLVKEAVSEKKVEKRPSYFSEAWGRIGLIPKLLIGLILLSLLLYSIFDRDIKEKVSENKVKHRFDGGESIQSLPKYAQGIYSDNRNEKGLCDQEDKHKVAIEANRILRYEATCRLQNIKKLDTSTGFEFKADQICMMEGNESKDTIEITFDKSKNRNTWIGNSNYSKCN